jgi:hypothetical protein
MQADLVFGVMIPRLDGLAENGCIFNTSDTVCSMSNPN